MTNPETSERDQKLVSLHAQLSAAMLERGLQHAHADDPNLYAQAQKWLAQPGARFELRASVDPACADVVTRGVVVDEGGDALVEVFTITGRIAPAQ